MSTVRTFGVETVHHSANEFKLILQTEVDEVGVDEDAVWWTKGSIMRQEQGGSNLRSDNNIQHGFRDT